MGRLDQSAVSRLGFAAVGSGVAISDRASFYNCSNISLGDNVRIDDFCVLSAGAGGIAIGRHVHLSVYSSLVGAGLIELDDFCNLSSRVSVFSSTDDYSGEFMTNPTVPAQFTGVKSADIKFGRHVIVGCGSVIIPGATLEEGVAIGALSLVRERCAAFGVYGGVPARLLKERKRDLLDKEKNFRTFLTAP